MISSDPSARHVSSDSQSGSTIGDGHEVRQYDAGSSLSPWSRCASAVNDEVDDAPAAPEGAVVKFDDDAAAAVAGIGFSISWSTPSMMCSVRAALDQMLLILRQHSTQWFSADGENSSGYMDRLNRCMIAAVKAK